MKKTKYKKKTKTSKVADKKTKTPCSCSANSWVIVAIVLAVLLVASLILGFSGVLAGQSVDLTTKLTQAGAENRAEEFVELLGEVERIPLNVDAVIEEHGLYSVVVEIMGQRETLFMSIDGELLFFQGITLDDIRNVKAQMDLMEQQPPQEPPLIPEEPAPRDININLENANYLGDLESDVVLVEYSSVTCPFCANFHAETFPSIKAEYLDDERILYVYKHFVRNEVDLIVGNAMECAGEQGSFFEYKNLVYENQNRLTQPEALSEWAEQLGLNMEAFNECVEEGRYIEKVNAESTEGRNNGITVTPGFLLNGEIISGARPFSDFQARIDALL